MKSIILVDGQNLYYNLKDMHLIEKQIKWDLFFKSLLESGDDCIRTYWFRPQRILDTYYTAQNIRNTIVYRNYHSYLHDYKTDKTKIPSTVLDKIEQEAVGAEEWLKKEKIKFSQIEYNYDRIPLEFGNIEICKKGIVKVNPFIKDYVGEKGVDIALAVKMISLSVDKRCDKIILVSGDYDYSEAIQFVKNNMTIIHVVKLHRGIPPINKSVSRDLAVLADKVINVYESEIKSTFSKP